MFWRTSKIDRLAVEKVLQTEMAAYPLDLETYKIQSNDVFVLLNVRSGEPEVFMPLGEKIEWQLRQIRGVKTARVLLTAERVSSPQANKTESISSSSPSFVHGHVPKKPPVQVAGLATGVRHIIAVASGKGGVGKSTVATNLAVALASQGIKTGLLDADIYGPSIPMMMGKKTLEPRAQPSDQLQPIQAYGVACMSIGFLVETDAPMIWRGPMVQTAIVQMLRDVDWSGVDVLIIDLPPGTGDAQLTMAQKIKLTGAIIVSTPQDVALLDARKGLEMFQKTNVPILGLVQNMGIFCCPNCGHKSTIFGDAGVTKLAAGLGVPLLADIPIDPKIREQGDAGVPITVFEPTGNISKIYQDLARHVIMHLTESDSKPGHN